MLLYLKKGEKKGKLGREMLSDQSVPEDSEH